ncbi:hypothetical protein G4B88_015390 [Cannabis sativa]|uniref:non-specific serine/threonine protein kinase n=1 Tax=Cannabis sativa TaxID=3483 RepID=A0A7J6DQW6_CANSA|nr:hypothetical protein G4B88_015390 [Cannabis sativa]
MKMLDHLLLLTFSNEFEDLHFSYIVMEYCSGGDLNSLRHKQPRKQFSVNSARFYAVEILSGEHIMLTEFNLSLCLDTIQIVVESPESSPGSSLFSFFFNRVFCSGLVETLNAANQLFVVESVTTRFSFIVGIHEYISPKMAKDKSHETVAQSHKTTSSNIINMLLAFPTLTLSCELELHARELTTGLLDKDSTKHLEGKRGAAEVKKHPFFKGLNLALAAAKTSSRLN